MLQDEFLIVMIACVVCVWLWSVRLVFRGQIWYVGMIQDGEGRYDDLV